MSPSRHLRLRFAATLLAALVLSACSKDAAQQAAFTPPPTAVETAVVQATTVADSVSAVGSVLASEQVTVTFEIDGRVVNLAMQEGELVGGGTVLARLDDSQARAELARAEAQLQNRRTILKRTRAMVEERIAAAQTLDDARAALRVAEADVALQKVWVDRAVVEAPFDGIVGARRVSPGAFVRAGDPLTELAKLDVVRVNFTLPERLMSQLHAGSPVEVTSPAHPGRGFEGHVRLVEPVLDAATRSVRVQALVDNADGALRPGMSAGVSVVLAQRPGAITVPSEAIFAEGVESLVYVVREDGTVARTKVTIGARQADTAEVTSGLRPGQVIVRSGHQKLYDGAKVQPVEDARTRGGAAAPGTTGAP